MFTRIKLSGFVIITLSSVAASVFVDTVEPSERALSGLLPWYHDSDQLNHAYKKLQKSCKLASVTFETHGSSKTQIQVVRINGTDKPSMKAAFFFGMHPRELISAESGLHFMETLCGQSDQVASVLQKVSFLILPNINVAGRRIVEDGDFCFRTNLDGVDLNRNWGYGNRSIEREEFADTNPGPHAFSEIETRVLMNLLLEERPSMFLDVHSGAYLMGFPFGSAPHRMPANVATIFDILKPLQTRYCKDECPIGNLAAVIGYQAPGIDIDYILEMLHVPFAFTFEIYTGEKFMWRYRKIASKQVAHSLLEVLMNDTKVRDNAACLEQFNPLTEARTTEVLETWTKVYVELCERVLETMVSSTALRRASSLSSLLPETLRQEISHAHTPKITSVRVKL